MIRLRICDKTEEKSTIHVVNHLNDIEDILKDSQFKSRLSECADFMDKFKGYDYESFTPSQFMQLKYPRMFYAIHSLGLCEKTLRIVKALNTTGKYEDAITCIKVEESKQEEDTNGLCNRCANAVKKPVFDGKGIYYPFLCGKDHLKDPLVVKLMFRAGCPHFVQYKDRIDTRSLTASADELDKFTSVLMDCGAPYGNSYIKAIDRLRKAIKDINGNTEE